MKDRIFGEIINGTKENLKKSYHEFSEIPIDLELQHEDILDYSHKYMKTIAEPIELSAPGTFDGRSERIIRFEPTSRKGWWFKRLDLPESEPVRVSYKNAFTVVESGVNNIVLKDSMNRNYMRLTEHIIALRLGLDIDNLMICTESNDPPLFENGSLDMFNLLDEAELEESDEHCKYYTVKNNVSAVFPNGSFLLISQPDEDSPFALRVDCAVNFNSAIGKQRVKFPVNSDSFKYGSIARTNTFFKHALLCKTVGKFFKSTRHLGYNSKNVLIAGKNKYHNEPRLMENGKSLEAVWHRGVLDLLAAFSLIEEGRFVGNIISYKAGHREDVALIKKLYDLKLLKKFKKAEI
jgi:UDP-3-O-acyl-N-acetylglucosamine deacetylase